MAAVADMPSLHQTLSTVVVDAAAAFAAATVDSHRSSCHHGAEGAWCAVTDPHPVLRLSTQPRAVEGPVERGASPQGSAAAFRRPSAWRGRMSRRPRGVARESSRFSTCGSGRFGSQVRWAENINGGTPLLWALHLNQTHAADTLLAAMPTDAALEDLCGPGTDFAHQLPSFIASHLPLAAALWALIPIAPIPGLARAPPASLACSVDHARQLAWRLPPPDIQSLCLAQRAVRRVPAAPAPLPRRAHPVLCCG